MRGMFRALIATLSLLTFAACSADDKAAPTAAAPSVNFEDGKQFKKVNNVLKPTDPKRITVEEFFWYGCQHCFHFDPVIGEWKEKKAPDVDFARIPANIGHAEGIVHEKFFYTAEALGIGEKVHTPFFNAIHEQRQPLFTLDAVKAWVNAQYGVLPDVFDSTYGSFTVDSRVRRADQLAKDYGLFSVPTVVVGGKYMTNASLAGGNAEMIQVIDFLTDKVRKERKS